MLTKQKFLSTPSARRATVDRHASRCFVHISIHALREEGDKQLKPSKTQRRHDFYPRPPRGGRQDQNDLRKFNVQFLSTPSARRATHGPLEINAYKIISIHALREEGDHRTMAVCSPRVSFLSTPSARRATAKTETKSLFSNKLYNILHEFRRALIYNGSKSYPNHAK